MDVHLFHELRRVDHHHVFDRRRRIILESGDRAEIGDAGIRRNVDDLHVRRAEERRHFRLVVIELDLVDVFSFGNVHRHRHARVAVEIHSNAGLRDANAERIGAGVDDDLVAGEDLSLFVERNRADLARLRHIAEIEIERVRRLTLDHHFLAVEIELDRFDVVADRHRVDVLQSAEKIFIAERHDAQRRLIRLNRFFECRYLRFAGRFRLCRIGGVEQLRNVHRILDDRFRAGVDVDDAQARHVHVRAEESIDDDRQLHVGNVAGKIESIAEVFEELSFLQHFAGDVETVTLRSADVFDDRVRARHEDRHLRGGASALFRGVGEFQFGRQFRRARRGDDDRLQDFVDVFFIDRRRREDFDEIGLVLQRREDRAIQLVGIHALLLEFRKAAELNSRFVAPRMNLGDLYLQYQNYPLAIQAYKEILDVEPLNLQANLNIGTAYMATSKVAEALDFSRTPAKPLVLPYRNPVVTAKMLASLDQMSNGRLILGIGVGYLPGEFLALGIRQKDTGAIG